MIKFKNKKTGLVWHITNKSHIKRLRANTDYSEVSNRITPKEESKTSSEGLDTSKIEDTVEHDNNTEYSDMDWTDLRSLASSKGINTHGKKREVIEQELGEIYETVKGASAEKD